jgi:hypothetical protein
LDTGFGDIRRYPIGSHAGIIVLRPPIPGRTACLRLIDQLLALVRSGVQIDGCLWVLDPTRLRIRCPE